MTAPKQSDNKNETPPADLPCGIAFPKSKEALILLLYGHPKATPERHPTLALVCFDDHPSRAPPKSLLDLAHYRTRVTSLKARTQTKATNNNKKTKEDDENEKAKIFNETELVASRRKKRKQEVEENETVVEESKLQVIYCCNEDIHPEKYGDENYPTYVLFRCGSDYRELAHFQHHRYTTHTSKLRSLVRFHAEQYCNEQDYTLHNALETRAKQRAAQLFQQLGVKYNCKLEMDSKGEGSVKISGYDCLFHVLDNAFVKLVAFIGKESYKTEEAMGEEDDKDEWELIRKVLCWNFTCPFDLGSFTISSLHRDKCHRFTLEWTANILEDNWNVTIMDNVTSNFGNACKRADQAIRELREEQKEKRGISKKDGDKEEKKDEEIPQISELRAKRLKSLVEEKDEKKEQEQKAVKKRTGKPVSKSLPRKRCNDKERSSYHCALCGKHYKCQAQLDNHLQSKKHKRMEKAALKRAAAEDNVENASIESEKISGDNTTAGFDGPTATNIPPARKPPTSLERQIAQKLSRKHHRRCLGSAGWERQVHRQVLRALIEQDREQRKENGGKLKPKLGIDGYQPTGTLYRQISVDNESSKREK